MKPLTLREQMPEQYEIGAFSYGNIQLHDWGTSKLKIGSYTSIGPGVEIVVGGEHHMEWGSMFPFHDFGLIEENLGHPISKGDIEIGSDVWIGAGAMILSGVTIGHGAVIGARALVTKNVEPYSVALGVPAKHQKWRFPWKWRAALLEIAWWNWPPERVRRAARMLQSPNVNDFIAAVERGEL